MLFIELKSVKSNTQSEFFLGWNHEIALDFGTSIVSRADNDAKTSGRGGYESWKPKSNGKQNSLNILAIVFKWETFGNGKVIIVQFKNTSESLKSLAILWKKAR